MIKKTISEINEIYELEFNRIYNIIKKEKPKKILLQFPEGLKQYSQIIADEIESNTKTKCFIWMGSCFGACDLPLEVEKLGIDLIIQFGHSNWNYLNKKNIKVL